MYIYIYIYIDITPVSLQPLIECPKSQYFYLCTRVYIYKPKPTHSSSYISHFRTRNNTYIDQKNPHLCRSNKGLNLDPGPDLYTCADLYVFDLYLRCLYSTEPI